MRATRVRKRCKACKRKYLDKDRRDGQPCPNCGSKKTIRIS